MSCLCDGYYLPKIEGICQTKCGDGIKTQKEGCDDNNTVNHDGCDSQCKN